VSDASSFTSWAYTNAHALPQYGYADDCHTKSGEGFDNGDASPQYDDYDTYEQWR
jgi:hypothetical protein